MLGTSMSPSGRAKPAAGMSLVEIMVASTILVMVLGVILRTTTMSKDATDYAKTSALLTVASQTRMLLIRDDLSASVRLFQNDTEGPEYLNRLDFGATPPVAGATLPSIAPYGTLGKDPVGTPRTGNVLFFARAGLPFPTPEERAAWDDICDAGSMPGRKAALEHLRLDTYRIIAYYPHWPGATAPNGQEAGLELVHWVSLPFADRDRFQEVPSADQESVLMALARPELRAIRWLWAPGDPSDSAFSEIESSWTLQAVNETNHPSWRIPSDQRQTDNTIFLPRRISLATVWAPPGQGVGRFAQVSSVSPGFPHGFEVQIIGPASARQVLVHMNLVGRSRRGEATWIEAQELINCRDL